MRSPRAASIPRRSCASTWSGRSRGIEYDAAMKRPSSPSRSPPPSTRPPSRSTPTARPALIYPYFHRTPLSEGPTPSIRTSPW
jgi:hypothetical protein